MRVCMACRYACINLLLLLKHLLRSRRRCTEQEVGCSSQDRAIIELEFVQCLANPHYLNCGCTSGQRAGRQAPQAAQNFSLMARDSCARFIRVGPEPLL